MAVGPFERRLAAILMADVVGFSRLAEADEARTLAAVRALREQVIDPSVADHRGRTVKLMGDGIIIEFGSVVDAVQCAVAIQNGVAASQGDIRPEERIQFRIGINLGDVVVEGDDLLGDGVNVAARLQQIADPGGVLIAGTVYDHLQGKLGLPLEFAGEQKVKNITRPVRAYRVRLNGAASRARAWPQSPVRLPLALAGLAAVLLVLTGLWWGLMAPGETTSAALPDTHPAVAVLPFDDLSGDERQKRWASGLTEDLITELARSRVLKVIARNSAESVREKTSDMREIGRQLGVHYILSGSLQTAADRLTISAQLIDTRDGSHIWSERYDRPAADLFELRDEILTQLVGRLTGYDGPIWAEWLSSAKGRPPENLTAFDYYLLAAERYRRHDAAGNAEARALLEKSVQLDPRFSRAWGFLADAHQQDALNGWSSDRARSWELFHEAAQRAADADPTDGPAQVRLGASYFTKGQTELGRAAWERALELSPNDALVNRAIGTQLPIALVTEEAERGVTLVRRALFELDPLHPPYQWMNLGIPLYFAGRFDEAISAFEKVPNPWLEVRVMLALSYAQAGQRDKASQHAQEVLKLDPSFSAEAWIDNDFYQPGGSSAQLIVDGARKAGLPLCASEVQAKAIDPGHLLSECEGARQGT